MICPLPNPLGSAEALVPSGVDWTSVELFIILIRGAQSTGDSLAWVARGAQPSHTESQEIHRLEMAMSSPLSVARCHLTCNG